MVDSDWLRWGGLAAMQGRVKDCGHDNLATGTELNFVLT